MAWNPQPIDANLIRDALEMGVSWQLSHWDALIVAAALRSGCTSLLTEDLNEGQHCDAVTVISPFSREPPLS